MVQFIRLILTKRIISVRVQKKDLYLQPDEELDGICYSGYDTDNFERFWYF